MKKLLVAALLSLPGLALAEGPPDCTYYRPEIFLQEDDVAKSLLGDAPAQAYLDMATQAFREAGKYRENEIPGKNGCVVQIVLIVQQRKIDSKGGTFGFVAGQSFVPMHKWNDAPYTMRQFHAWLSQGNKETILGYLKTNLLTIAKGL